MMTYKLGNERLVLLVRRRGDHLLVVVALQNSLYTTSKVHQYHTPREGT